MKRLGLAALFAFAIYLGLATAPAHSTIRVAPYYPWFPETWTVNGSHVFYQPYLGYYSSEDLTVQDAHLSWLKYARIHPISSWWGIGHVRDERLDAFLARTSLRSLQASVKWSVYYECEGNASSSCHGRPDPTDAELAADLDYLYAKATHPAWLRVNAAGQLDQFGKPVIFVYNVGDGCEVTDRWNRANAGRFYVVLKVLSGYQACIPQPDSWHQYGPGSPIQRHLPHSVSISPGFWRADEAAPRLARGLERFKSNVRECLALNPTWCMVVSFNEWGEGTAIEAAQEWIDQSVSCLGANPPCPGYYLQALNRNGL